MDPSTELDLGSGTLDLSGGEHTVAGLSGSGGSVNIDNGGLTVNQDGDTEFAGVIEGNGGFNKSGDGRLNLTGNSTYSGPTSVSGGTLSVNGSLNSVVTVEGGALGGSGTVGGVIAAPGGTVAPGNSIGHLKVAGDVSLAAGSVYAVEVTPAGEADRLSATGSATINGGTVSVLAADGQYAGRTRYTILTAEEGITGTFGSVTSNLAFLSPSLFYSDTAITLELLRNDINFASIATTANQSRTARAIEALGPNNALFEAVLLQDSGGARTAFDALSGELYPSVSAGLLNDSRHVRDAVFANAKADSQGVNLWAQVLGSWGQADAHEGMARLTTDYQGVIVGLGHGGNGFTLGFAAGLSDANYRAGARASSADVSSQFLAVHGGLALGALSFQIGGAYAWHDIDASRSIVFPGYSGSVSSEYDASTRQLFGELAYGIPAGGLTLSPFARLAHARTRTDSFAESGDSQAALGVASHTRTLDLISLGLRLDGSLEVSSKTRLTPAVSVAWQRAWGDRMDSQDARFAQSSASFAIQGQQIQRTSAVVDAGVALDFGAYTIGAAYKGSFADRWADHGGKVSVAVRF